MTAPNDGGPAFPSLPPRMALELNGSITPVGFEGMSLRDYFAAKAMAALLEGVQKTLEENRRRGIPEARAAREAAEGFAAVPASAYITADRMLAERAKVRA